MSGFIALHREAFEHPLLKDGDRFRAWFWMVSRACWKPTKFDVGGRIITLERGQFSCSVREMAQAWGWSKSAVDRFIQRLVDEDMVISTRAKTGTGGGTQSGTGRAVITICNYDKYQSTDEFDGTDSGTARGTAAGQQRDIKEEGNNRTTLETIVSNDADASQKSLPLDQPIDMVKAVFDTGIRLFGLAGIPPPKARSIIGRWRKTYSDGAVLSVLARCDRERPEQPIEWITRALQVEARRAAGQSNDQQYSRPARKSTRELAEDVAARLSGAG